MPTSSFVSHLGSPSHGVAASTAAHAAQGSQPRARSDTDVLAVELCVRRQRGLDERATDQHAVVDLHAFFKRSYGR